MTHTHTHASHDPDTALAQAADALDFPLGEPIQIGGRYSAVRRDGRDCWVSGQVPRVRDTVVVTGAVGDTVDQERARHAARVCALRALCLLQAELGSLRAVASVLRVTVYVRSAPDFTGQSEVADAASDLLVAVLGDAGRHSRTSVGVAQLPKGAAVELDLVARVADGA